MRELPPAVLWSPIHIQTGRHIFSAVWRRINRIHFRLRISGDIARRRKRRSASSPQQQTAAGFPSAASAARHAATSPQYPDKARPRASGRRHNARSNAADPVLVGTVAAPASASAALRWLRRHIFASTPNSPVRRVRRRWHCDCATPAAASARR